MIDWAAFGSGATAIGVFVAAWQIRRATRQAMTDFEDDLTREYRSLVRGLSVEAQLGKEVSDKLFAEDYSRLVQYIDLSNEQVFLRQSGRVSRDAWDSWRDGIKTNLAKPAFQRAWLAVKEAASGSFAELKKLEKTRFTRDPRTWISSRQRIWRWLSAG